MSVLARPQWFMRSPPRLPAELSPLSAASAGSPSGNEGDAESACGGYGGSLIMVQQECTERAAEAEEEERLCSVVLDPLPSALLHSLGARGHVRMTRPPAAATSWPPSPPEQPQTTLEEDQDDVRLLVHDLVSAVDSDASATQWTTQQAAAPQSPTGINEHRHRKKHRKARRESHDSEGRRKRRKRSTSSSSGSYCVTPGSEVEAAAPRVNPIFVWVTQSEESTITKVLCEDYDKRNRIRLTKTPNGWRAIPRTERLAVLQPNAQQEDTARSPSPDPNATLDLSHKKDNSQNDDNSATEDNFNEAVDVHDNVEEVCDERLHEDITSDEQERLQEGITDEQDRLHAALEDDALHEQVNADVDEEIQDELCGVHEGADVEAPDLHLENDLNVHMEENEDMVLRFEGDDDELQDELEIDVSCKQHEAEVDTIVTEELKDYDAVDSQELEDQIEEIEEEEEDVDLKSEIDLTQDENKEEIIKSESLEIDESDLLPKNLEAGDEAEAREPPPAHASSIAVKSELVEPAADLSQRARRPSGLLPCRSPLRLPPLMARPLPSPVARSNGERRTPSPAHQQQAHTHPLSATALCGTKVPSPAHQHERHSPFLENLLTQQPLSLEAKRPSASKDPPAKRRCSEDITLRNLLVAGVNKPSAPVEENKAPRSRLLELLTTSSPPRKSIDIPAKPAPVPTPPDALAQLRQVLSEVAVPDPLLVPRSRLAALLASPAVEIPRLVHSPTLSTTDTLAVSLSRLQSLLRRPDSELLAWAAQDWAQDPPPKSQNCKSAPKVKPPVIPKVPMTKPPALSKHPSSKPPTPNSLPWWAAAQKTPVIPPPPPTPEMLAAFHALYGSALIQHNYFAPPFPSPHELALWPGVTLTEAAKPPPPPPPVAAAEKPRIVCKNLLELLATKPDQRASERGKPALDLTPPPVGKQPEKRQQQQQQQSKDAAGCPRLWHPLFGSQKSNSWNWRQVAVNGD